MRPERFFGNGRSGGEVIARRAACGTSPCVELTNECPARGSPARAADDENFVRYEIRPELSDIRFLVYKAGALARLGHNHVITAKGLSGEVRLAPDIHRSRFSLEMMVADFQVDDESARRDEGAAFFPQPDAEVIRGTRKNMLGEQVLDAARYPSIRIESVALSGPEWGMDIRVRIRLHGVEREELIPAALDRRTEQLAVMALFTIRQSDFGITPMSVLGGALQVDDAVRVRLRIVATPALAG